MPKLHSLTLANAVSLSRLVLAIAFVAVGGTAERLAIILVAALSDFADGWLARRRNDASPLGAIIDPAADRAFVLVVVGTLLAEGALTWTQTLVLMARDVVTTIGIVAVRTVGRLRSMRLEARFSGKVVTALQFLTLVAAIAAPGAIPWLLSLVALAGVVSIVDYSAAAWRAGKAVAVCAALLVITPGGIPAQGFPDGGGGPVSAGRYRPEARADVFIARTEAMHLGAGLAIDAGTYVRLAAIIGAGAARLHDETVASGRVEVVGRFVLDPFRQARWGLYAATGVVGRVEDGAGTRGQLTLLVGAEMPTARTTVTAIEVGIGGGARIGLTLRRGRPGRR